MSKFSFTVPSARQGATRTRSASGMLVLLCCVFVASCGGGGDNTPATGPDPPAAPLVLTVVSGNGQQALITQALPGPVVVRVTKSGAAVVGANVSFEVTQGGGSVLPAQSATDAAGEARTTWTMGSAAGTQSLRISATSGVAAPPVAVTATATPGITLQLAQLDGNEQTAVAGSAVLVSPAVSVRNSSGVALPGVTIRFVVTSGSGTVAGADAISDASGVARAAAWILGSVPGANAMEARPVGDTLIGTPVTFFADGVAPGGIVSLPAREYPVSATSPASITDSVSGARFDLPQGGTGVLSVSRITSGVTNPGDSGVAVRVLWDGGTPMEIVLPRTESAEPQVFVWRRPDLYMESLPDSQWAPIGGDDRPDAKRAFATLAVSTSASRHNEALTGTITSARKVGWGQYFVSFFVFSASEKAFFAARELDARSAIQKWIDAVPDAAKKTRASQIVSSYPLTFSRGRKCPSYYGTQIPKPSIYTCSGPGKTIKSGAHEAGHYMTDVLLYDAGKSMSVLSLAPGMINSSRPHEWGDTWMGFRRTITESYAFFSEWLEKGKVGDAFFPDGRNEDFFLVLSNNGAKTPETIDYPSMEGFTISYIGALLRAGTDTLMYNFAGSPGQAIPISGLSTSDIVGIYSGGPKTIDEFQAMARLRTAESKLSVIAERVGWSYNALGRVVDSVTGDALPGVILRPIIKDGGRSYTTIFGTTTGNDGRFYLPRVFPGAQYLRGYRDRSEGGIDSADYVVNPGWDRPTNNTIEWNAGKDGDILLKFPISANRKTYTFSEQYDPVTLLGNNRITTNASASILAPDSSQTRGGLYYLEFFRLPVGSPASTVVSMSATVEPAYTTTWDAYEGGVDVRYTFVSRGCRAARKPHSTMEVTISTSCSLTHELAPGAEGEQFTIYVTYNYTRDELDEKGIPKGSPTSFIGERKLAQVYVW